MHKERDTYVLKIFIEIDKEKLIKLQDHFTMPYFLR